MEKVYSLAHPASLGKSEGFFTNMEDSKSKNIDDKNADMFSILHDLENHRTCGSDFHFKLCYPELAEKHSFPCNEWIQSNNPVVDSIIRDFKQLNISLPNSNSNTHGGWIQPTLP